MLWVDASNELHQVIFLRTFLNHELFDVAWHFLRGFCSALVEVPSLVIKLRIVIFNAQEGLNLVRLLYRWDHNDILQVALQSISTVYHHV